MSTPSVFSKKAADICTQNEYTWPVPKRFTLKNLIDELAALTAEEQLELCDALVDDPRLRELLEAIDDYLYLETDDEPPLNLAPERLLN